MFAALMGMALFIGHRQPVSPQIHAWRLDECAKPCWMNIVPGKSTIPEAYQQVSAVLKPVGYTLEPLPPSWNDLGAFLKIKDKSGRVDPDAIILFAGKTILVDEFGVWRGQVDPIMPTFGDFVSLFGSPTCVSSTLETNTVILTMYYNDSTEKSTLGVVMDANRFSWTQPVYAFFMGDNIAPGFNNTCITQPYTAPWQGLRSADYYITATQ